MNRNMNLFERFRTDKFDQSNDAIILQGKQMGGGKIANYLKLSAQLLTHGQIYATGSGKNNNNKNKIVIIIIIITHIGM